MDQLGISAIHPTAPDFVDAAALFSAPIDVTAAIARLKPLWGIEVVPDWSNPDGSPADSSQPIGRVAHVEIEGVHMLLTPMNEGLVPQRGTLPSHRFYVAVTAFVEPGIEVATAATFEIPELAARKRMVTAYVKLTQMMDALLREPAGVGMFNPALGVVMPPRGVEELSNSLTQGVAPLPLWINVRVFDGELRSGRTLGLPMFGHLDLEIIDSTVDPRTMYEALANVANYIISGDSYLLPGQTMEVVGKSAAITQAVSGEGDPVIRLAL